MPDDAAAKLPDDAPNRKKDLVTRFRDEYGEVLAAAKIAAEHTATPGWQKLYGDHRRAGEAERRRISKILTSHGQSCELNGLCEDARKTVKDAVKAAETLENDDAVFDRDVVEKVKGCVRRAESLINEYRQRANVAEANAPLVEIGLIGVMNEAISKQPVPVWDDTKGVVTIENNSRKK